MYQKLNSCIVLIRPYQWVKNLLLFAPLFFSGNTAIKSLFLVCLATVCFSIVSSLGYILNDWVDRERDLHHFQKKKRPFCTGAVNGFDAICLSVFLLLLLSVISLMAGFSKNFWLIIVIYLALTISYSLYLKHVVILEIFIISMGFVIRVFAGGAACGINISSWLFLTVFFLSVLISVAKRLAEFNLLGDKTAVLHRKSQKGYTRTYLQNLQWACGCISLVVYSLYVVEHRGIIIYSIIPAAYGVFRFIYLTDQGKGGDPIKTMVEDRQLVLTTLVFLLFLSVTIYY